MFKLISLGTYYLLQVFHLCNSNIERGILKVTLEKGTIISNIINLLFYFITRYIVLYLVIIIHQHYIIIIYTIIHILCTSHDFINSNSSIQFSKEAFTIYNFSNFTVVSHFYFGFPLCTWYLLEFFQKIKVYNCHGRKRRLHLFIYKERISHYVSRYKGEF